MSLVQITTPEDYPSPLVSPFIQFAHELIQFQTPLVVSTGSGGPSGQNKASSLVTELHLNRSIPFSPFIAYNRFKL